LILSIKFTPLFVGKWKLIEDKTKSAGKDT